MCQLDHQLSKGRMSWYVPLVLALLGHFQFCKAETSEDPQMQSSGVQLTATIAQPTPEQDDAALHDVAMIGEAHIWAVGDHGTILRSRDGGASWQFLSLTPELRRYSLNSLCFLTDRVGWIAGGTVLPVGGVPQGILLHTKDGGETWTVQHQQLPYLRFVRFFDLEQGVVAGDRSIAAPSGVLATTDGGQLWTPMSSSSSGRWNAAAFASPQSGILAGAQGRHAIVARGAILPQGDTFSGLRAFHGASLDGTGRGWLAGEGALIVRTDNGGVSWEPVHTQLPVHLGDFSNFHGVSHVEDHAWVVGSPGSIIWHTADAGQTWEAQQTGDPIPLEAVRFINPRQGAAVGQLGRICITLDGGKNWINVRGQGRRLTCLAVQTHVKNAAISMLTRWGLEEGYRSAVMIATRSDTGEDSRSAEFVDLRLRHAVQTAGGVKGWIDWRLPVGLPNLEKDREKLIREWTLLTDQRLEKVLLESLVAEIRIWRPSAILVDAPVSGEFTSDLIQKAVSRAMIDAAEPTFAPEQSQIAALQPWTVRKLIACRSGTNTGPITQDPHEVLPYLQTTLELASAEAFGQLRDGRTGLTPVSYLVIKSDRPSGSMTGARGLFQDLEIPPGSDARRKLRVLQSEKLETLMAQAKHRRSISAISQQMAADPSKAPQLLGKMNQIVAPLSPEQAAAQLAEMGRLAHENGQWNLAESIYAELVSRYSDQPPAVDAMVWLVRYWTSAEMNWQRLRSMRAIGSLTRGDIQPGEDVAQASLQEAIETFRKQPTRTAAALNTPSLGGFGRTETKPIELAAGTIQSMAGGGDGGQFSQYELQLRRWQMAAAAVANGMREAYPVIFDDPQVQFSIAALYRRRSENRKADEIYDTFLRTLSDDPWHVAARGEAYLLRPGVQSPKPVVICRSTQTPPILDGILSDDCWKSATEIRLGNHRDSEMFVGTASASKSASTPTERGAVVFLAHDDRFLYFAASVPIHPELPTDPPERAGRNFDADLDLFDRISLQLDVDRDYGTYYRFDVDQRGQTREACWENWDYNPKWYVATTREQDSWRMEAAIPLEELLPPERISGTCWGVGITRIMPGIGSQSWTGAGATVPQPALFGLMRFE